MASPQTKALLLRLHRWTTLIFAIPLAILIVTGLVLSFSPIIQSASITPGSLTLAQLEQHVTKHDLAGKARSLFIDHRNGTMTLRAGRRGPRTTVDLKSGEKTSVRSPLNRFLFTNRMLHEHFIFRLDWVVPLSTAAMLVSMLFGIFMGWPRFSNSLAGWHKGVAWTLLPLLILSPLTGLMLSYRISFNPPAPRSKPLPLLDVVSLTAKKHDPSMLVTIRQRGPRQFVSINTGTRQILYQPNKQGLRQLPTNVPRVFHQGDFFGIWGGVMNVILSLAFSLLLISGLWIWARRTFRPRQRVRNETIAAE